MCGLVATLATSIYVRYRPQPNRYFDIVLLPYILHLQRSTIDSYFCTEVGVF